MFDVRSIVSENSLVTKPELRDLWASYDHLGKNKGYCISVHPDCYYKFKTCYMKNKQLP